MSAFSMNDAYDIDSKASGHLIDNSVGVKTLNTVRTTCNTGPHLWLQYKKLYLYA